MNDPLARPFSDCLSCLLVLRFVALTLVAIVTTSLLLLGMPPATDRQPGPRVLYARIVSEEPPQKHYARWYDDFPSDEPGPAEGGEFDSRRPELRLEPRPILP